MYSDDNMKKTWWQKTKRKIREMKINFKKWRTRDRVDIELFVDELDFVEHAFIIVRKCSLAEKERKRKFLINLFVRGFLGLYFRELNLITINLSGIYRCFENWEEKLPDVISHEYLHHAFQNAEHYDTKEQEEMIQKMALCSGRVKKNFKKPHYKMDK